MTRHRGFTLTLHPDGPPGRRHRCNACEPLTGQSHNCFADTPDGAERDARLMVDYLCGCEVSEVERKCGAPPLAGHEPEASHA